MYATCRNVQRSLRTRQDTAGPQCAFALQVIWGTYAWRHWRPDALLLTSEGKGGSGGGSVSHYELVPVDDRNGDTAVPGP